MLVYMTSGTFEYLKKLEEKYREEIMVTMVNQNGALLFHETTGETLFKEPRRYEVIETIGAIPKEGFVAMNNIPVTEEGRPLFEHQMMNRGKQVETEKGFLALRVLRPLSSNTYVIMTVWKDETDFDQWRKSESFFSAHKNKGFSHDGQPKIFESSPYLSKYTITE